MSDKTKILIQTPDIILKFENLTKDKIGKVYVKTNEGYVLDLVVNQAYILALKLGILAKMDEIKLEDLLKFIAQCYYDVEERFDEILDIVQSASEVKIVKNITPSEGSRNLLTQIARILNSEREKNERTTTNKF